MKEFASREQTPHIEELTVQEKKTARLAGAVKELKADYDKQKAERDHLAVALERPQEASRQAYREYAAMNRATRSQPLSLEASEKACRCTYDQFRAEKDLHLAEKALDDMEAKYRAAVQNLAEDQAARDKTSRNLALGSTVTRDLICPFIISSRLLRKRPLQEP